jgi:hypothetical protein
LRIGRVEAFGEPAIDRREKVAGFGVAALVAAELGEAYQRVKATQSAARLTGGNGG